jgi:hypothetical protein
MQWTRIYAHCYFDKIATLHGTIITIHETGVSV